MTKLIQTDHADFLQLAGKRILIFGVANRKSVAYHIGRVLTEAGAECLYVVQNEDVRQGVAKLLGEAGDSTLRRRARRADRPAAGGACRRRAELHGLVHSIAAADYSEGMKPFHETPKKAFCRRWTSLASRWWP